MRIIPGKTKVQLELFKGVTLTDMLIGLVGAILLIFVLVSNMPGKMVFAIVIGGICAMLLVRLDAEPNYVFIMNMIRHF